MFCRARALAAVSYAPTRPRPKSSSQVAGVNYQVLVKAGDAHVTIHAFKPLPHTGGALEVKDARVGEWA